jgi:hypothetical protein
MTIDIPQDVKDRIRSEKYGKKLYTMDQAIYWKIRQHGIEVKKAVEIAMSLDKMLNDSFPNGKDTHLTEEEIHGTKS